MFRQFEEDSEFLYRETARLRKLFEFLCQKYDYHFKPGTEVIKEMSEWADAALDFCSAFAEEGKQFQALVDEFVATVDSQEAELEEMRKHFDERTLKIEDFDVKNDSVSSEVAKLNTRDEENKENSPLNRYQRDSDGVSWSNSNSSDDSGPFTPNIYMSRIDQKTGETVETPAFKSTASRKKTRLQFLKDNYS